jgi:hypothetical protein
VAAVVSEKKSAEWPTLGEEVARKDTATTEENNNSVWNNKDKIDIPIKSLQDIEATEKSSVVKDSGTEQQPKSSTTSTSAIQKPKVDTTNLSNDRKRVNTKPKWSRFEEDYKSSSSQKRRTDRDRYDDRPIRRGTGTGSSSTAAASTTSSSSRYNSIRSSRSSQASSVKSAVSRGRRENGYYSSSTSQKTSAQTNGDYKDGKSTAKQLTGRPVVIDPSHFYGTYYFSNPLDVAVGSLKESIKRQM